MFAMKKWEGMRYVVSVSYGGTVETCSVEEVCGLTNVEWSVMMSYLVLTDTQLSKAHKEL